VKADANPSAAFLDLVKRRRQLKRRRQFCSFFAFTNFSPESRHSRGRCADYCTTIVTVLTAASDALAGRDFTPARISFVIAVCVALCTGDLLWVGQRQ
jgi:hypothetical protein